MKFVENIHYYLENGKAVMTAEYHKQRGKCCGNKCRHCPYVPKWTKGVTDIDESFVFHGETKPPDVST